jgi:hypothetical protein
MRTHNRAKAVSRCLYHLLNMQHHRASAYHHQDTPDLHICSRMDGGEEICRIG